jgi:hypothetical protein
MDNDFKRDANGNLQHKTIGCWGAIGCVILVIAGVHIWSFIWNGTRSMLREVPVMVWWIIYGGLIVGWVIRNLKKDKT